jgi:hypothetical protein
MRRTLPVSLLLVLACGLAGMAAPKPRPSAARLANAAEVRQKLGLSPEYDKVRGLDRVKLAVLDYGFDGLGGARRYLPKDAVVVEDYDPDFVRRFSLGDPNLRKSFAPQNSHGRLMAQIVWSVTGRRRAGPKFYLLNANGPTMLRRAVRYAIEAKVDIILFSGVFEGGGNGDGRGPINRVVDEAIAAGIIWVNAAGNFGRCVYNGPVRVGPDGFLQFREGPDGDALRFRNRLDENTVTVTLTWDDYRDTEDAGTTKDLDLYVEDWRGRQVGASELKQIVGDRAAGPGESRNPRERIVLADLPGNPNFNYRIRARARTQNFTRRDRIRVLITASRDSYMDPKRQTPVQAVKFFDASGEGELYPPADNPRVLTVGDAGKASSVGPTADNRVKPDVVIEDSAAFFTNGEVLAGSSNAAAYFAGVIAVLKAAEPGLQTRHLLRLAHLRVKRTGVAAGSPTRKASRPKRAGSPTVSGYGAAPYPRAVPHPYEWAAPRSRSASKTPRFVLDLGRLGRIVLSPYGPLPRSPRRPAVYPGLGSRYAELYDPAARKSPGPRSGPPPRPRSVAEARRAIDDRIWRTPSRAELARLVAPKR